MVSLVHISFACASFYHEQRSQELKHIDSVGLVITPKSWQIFLLIEFWKTKEQKLLLPEVLFVLDHLNKIYFITDSVLWIPPIPHDIQTSIAWQETCQQYLVNKHIQEVL